MSTVVMLLVCLSSVVRADGLVDESSVAAMAKAMRDEMREELREEMREEMREQTSKQQQIVKLKDALEKKEEDARKAKTEPTHVQLTTGGEVVELVSATGFKGLAERFDAAEEKSVAQDAEIGTIGTTVSKMREELKTGRAPSDERGDQLARELDAAKATLAAQQAQISELSATVAQLLATPQTCLTPVDATKTTASRRLEEAGSPPPSLATEAICAPEAWVGYDGETCGECAALVKVRDNGGTCAGFCSLQGLDCVEGWDDETDNECSLGAAVKACDHSFGVGTSDAVCKCAQPPDDPPQPPTSPPRPPTAPQCSLLEATITSCTASSEYSDQYSCDKAYDGERSAWGGRDTNIAWATDAGGVGSWIELTFEKFSPDAMRFSNRQWDTSSQSINKGLQLDFTILSQGGAASIATRQMELIERTADVDDWTYLHRFEPVAGATSVRITVLSVYAFVNNGASEIALYDSRDCEPLPPPPPPTAPVCRVLISRQTVVAGDSWLRTDAEWSINPLNPSAAQFSILDQLEGMGRNPDGDNKILFELYWPELEGTQAGPRQLWKQSSNPVIGVPGAVVEGYEAVDAPYTVAEWGGLQRCGTSSALLDGSTNSNWWYAVGSRSVHEGGIPGPEIVGSLTELYVHTPCASLSPPSPSSPPSQPPPSPRSPPLSPPPAWPPLPAKANELRISGRHTAIAFNTNVDGVEPFRCVGVSDGKLTCSGELRAADFRTADGISLAELARFTGMVPPSAPPPPMPPTPPPAVYVSPGISTIQDAHDLASPGSELILADGIYLSSTSGTEVLRISKSIRVRALNPGQAVLHAQASAGNPACRRGSTCRRVIHILGGVVSLEGLNITGGMRDGHPYGGAGLAIVGGATVTVNKCNIYDNHVHNSGGLEINDRGGGVLITGRSTVSIVNSHIFGNTAENHGGVYVISGNAVLDSCLVYDSNVHAGCAYWNKRNLCTGREDGDEASVCYKSLALTNVQECA
eukprot:scaffold39359_cov69-Phaeocystis_antarctica.AAC.2